MDRQSFPTSALLPDIRHYSTCLHESSFTEAVVQQMHAHQKSLITKTIGFVVGAGVPSGSVNGTTIAHSESSNHRHPPVTPELQNNVRWETRHTL